MATPEDLDQPPSWLASPPQASAAAPPAAPLQAPVFAPPPPAPPAAAPPVQAEPAPAWSAAPPSASRLPTYMAGAALATVVLIAAVLVYPMLRPGPTYVSAVQVTPSPLIPDYERADRFLNVDLGPSLLETNQALPAVNSKCTSTLPPPCKDALIALNKAMIDVDDAMTANQRDIPVCIGRPVAQFEDDWKGIEQGVSMAIGGFTSNNRTLTITGLQKFTALAKFLQPDIDRINKAQQTCAKTV